MSFQVHRRLAIAQYVVYIMFIRAFAVKPIISVCVIFTHGTGLIAR